MNKYKAVMWILIVIMMGIIFGFSCQSGENSVALSSAVAEGQHEISSKIVDGGITDIDDFVRIHIRPMAHCFLYFVLAILIFTQCRLYGLKPFSAFILTVGSCFLYGLSDEFHQRFTEGRTSCMSDVYADTFGACIGGVLCFVKEEIIKLFYKGARK